MSPIDAILAVYRSRGAIAYTGEPISQLEHALQTALRAEHSGADAPLIVASLLHDYGHLIHELGEEVFKRGDNDRHEVLGADRLSEFFPAAVTEPIRLHVEAKRYLCAADPAYARTLSPASVWSLNVQGGAYDDAQAAEFLQRPFAAQAAQLRRFDEQAKVTGLATPDLEHFRKYLEACMRA
jgi:[1-hydroxy-2-(trimethylamino)ethyl]phosphonate dioxygenase